MHVQMEPILVILGGGGGVREVFSIVIIYNLEF